MEKRKGGKIMVIIECQNPALSFPAMSKHKNMMGKSISIQQVHKQYHLRRYCQNPPKQTLSSCTSGTVTMVKDLRGSTETP